MTLNLDNYTIGVELEFTGLSRAACAKIVANYFHSKAKQEPNYRYKIIDNQQRTWVITGDSSIKAERKKDDKIVSASSNYGVELVTPVLRYSADISTLLEIVERIRSKGGLVNTSNGLHVHVGSDRFDCRVLRNLVNIVYAKQNLLYKALKVHPNRAGFHCSPIDQSLVVKLNTKKPDNMEYFKKIYYSALGCDVDSSEERYSPARYYAVNLHSYFYRGTVEFRIYNSTLIDEWIQTYIILSIAIVNQAVSQKKSSSKPVVTDNEKYAFRTWLLSMGLIGSEYRTVRHNLLFYLEGDSAFRYERVGTPYNYIVDDTPE